MNINWLNRNQDALEEWFLGESVPRSGSKHKENMVLLSVASRLEKTATDLISIQDVLKQLQSELCC